MEAEEKKMTDQEKDKLIVEALGECWHTPGKSTIKEDGDYQCIRCGRWFEFVDSEHWNPRIATPEGFFWWWERAQKMEWWGNFLFWVYNGKSFGIGFQSSIVPAEFINPTQGRDALYEFLKGRNDV